jgi:RING-type zinc-finger
VPFYRVNVAIFSKIKDRIPSTSEHLHRIHHFLRHTPRKLSPRFVIALMSSSSTDNDDDISVQEEEVSCPICHQPYGTKNPDGIIEQAYMLCCGHVYGSDCIRTWIKEGTKPSFTTVNGYQIQAPTNPTCPKCRFLLKYTICGHLISPIDISVAFPKLKKKEDTPENCLACELQGLKAQRKLDRLLMEKGDREEDMEDVGEVDKEGLAAIDKKIEKAKKKLEVARKEKRDEIMGQKSWCL